MRVTIKSLIQKALFLLLISLAGASYAQVTQNERDALVALYNSTDGANWTDNTGWLGAAGTECSWFGIGCSNGHVEYLDLADNTLSGSIPTQLGNLTNLTSLSLDNNILSGSIPTELGNLTNLTILYLDDNSLSGSIPSELGNLTNLTGLYLFSNSLSGSIPSELGNLTDLTFLWLNNNTLSGSIPIELGNLTKLTSLFLHNNSLSGSIPTQLGNLTNLISLYLFDNSLSGSIPTQLGNLKNLTSLYLFDNSLSGSIPIELGNLTNLTKLNLSFNSLSGSIPFELGKLTKLTERLLNNNSFGRDADKDGIDDEIDSDPSYASPIKLVTDQKEYSISILGSGRVVNWVSPSSSEKMLKPGLPFYEEIESLSNSLYSHFFDEFDFMSFAANLGQAPKGAVSFASYAGITNFVTGIGTGQERQSPWIYDTSAQAGSDGKLLGWLEFKTRDGIKTAGLHEVAHRWGNGILFSTPKVEEEKTGHWGYRNIGGSLGGWLPGSLEDLGGGQYRAKNPVTGEFGEWSPGGNQNNTYGDFELYLMGLINATSVDQDIKTAEDFEWIDKTAGIFKASSITTMSMDQLIAAEGVRNPNYLNSQKSFQGIYVVLSEEPLTLEEWRSADKAVYDFQLTSDTGNTNDNFWRATKGKATISFDLLDSFSKRPLTSIASTDTTVTSPNNKKPIAAILGGRKVVITDTDGAAGESILVQATASDNDGTIVSTEWSIEGEAVAGATGLSTTLSLKNGATLITFKATDNRGTTTSSTQTINVLGSTTTATITVEAFNISPAATISGGSRTISDTDNAAGESVSFTATATDSDGTIESTQWLVDGVEVATGLSATIALPNGSTVVTFKATDDDGASSITTATITVASPAYEPTKEWPSPYNGVTPDSSFGLEFKNVGVLNSSDATIYACLRIFTDGLPSAVNGVSQFDMGLKVASLSEATVQITKFREFNAISALNEDGQTPDCSGIFETTTGVYTDIIQTDTSVLETTWNLIDPTNLILKLDSFKELSAN